MAGHAEGLRGVVDEVAVPARSNGQINAQAVAHLSHPAGLQPGFIERCWQAGVHRAARLVDKGPAEARSDQQRRVDCGGWHADRQAGLKRGQAEAVVAQPRQFGRREDQLLQCPRFGPGGKLAARGLIFLPGLARRGDVIRQQRLGKVLRITECSQPDPGKEALVDWFDRRQWNDCVVGPGGGGVQSAR